MEIMKMSKSELIVKEKKLRKQFKKLGCVTKEDRCKKSSYYQALINRMRDLKIYNNNNNTLRKNVRRVKYEV